MRFRLFTDIPFRLQYGIVLPVLVLVFAASIFFIVRSYLRHRRELNSQWIIALIVLRTLAVIVLFLSILKPVIGGMAGREQLGRVAVFIDNSRSMEVEDAVGARSRLDIAKWYLFGKGRMKKRLSRHFLLEEYIFGENVSKPGNGRGRFPETSDSTSIANVVAYINELRRNRNLLAAVVLTDGRNNVGNDEDVFRQRISAPVFTVGIGKKERTEQERVDLGVRNVLSKKVIQKKTKSPVNFTLSKVNISGREIRVTVTDEENALAGEKMIKLPEGNGEYSFSMEIVPDEKGIHRYKLSVPLIASESITANNSRYFTVNVIDPELNVLYFEGRPRYELKFIRRTLEESPNVHLYSIVRTREDYYYVQGSTPEIELEKGFPKTYEELKQFSVLLLGTGGTSALTKTELANIVRYVEDGKGLILLGSEDLASFAGTELEKLIPLRLARGRTPDSFNLELTSEGKRHPILAGCEEKFTADPRLAELSGRVLTGTRKFGTTVLAEGNEAPVIAVQNYGKGRVMLITADNTWQWYMRCRKLGHSSLYAKFWLQSIQWIAGFESVEKEKHFPIVFYTEKDYYNVAEEIKFELQTTEDIKDIDVYLKRDDQDMAEVKLEPAGEDGGRYSSSITLNEMSDYEIEVSYQGEKRSVRVVVGERLKEILETRLNDELLKRIAYSSGGKYFDISARSGLIDAMRALVVKRREVEEELGIWDTPWPFVVFVLLVGTEWFLRRWRQLI